VYALAIVVGLAARAPPLHGRRRRHGRGAPEPPADPLAPPRFELAKASTIAVTFCALLFGLFTACMLGDQWAVLRTQVAKIDRLKGEETEVASDVNEVFGGRSRGFRLDWLVPTAPVFPDSVRDDIMGYHVAARDLAGVDLRDADLEANDARTIPDATEVKTELLLPTTQDEVRSRAKPASSISIV